MSERVRCPKCNRYGNKDLDGYCKACYEPGNYMDLLSFKRKLSMFHSKVASSAILEAGVKTYSDVKPEDRQRVIYICQRRSPVKRRIHLVQSVSPLESYGYAFKEEKHKYDLEKEVPDIEYRGA